MLNHCIYTDNCNAYYILEWQISLVDKAGLQNGYDLADFFVTYNENGKALTESGIPIEDAFKLKFKDGRN